MDADNASISGTPKTGTSASSVQTPTTLPESAISSTPEGAGSRKESNEEKRWNVVVRTIPYAHTYGLLIPLRIIPVHQRRDDVIEAKVSRLSDPLIEYPLYTTHKPGYKRAYLDLFLTEPKPKEEFRIGMVRRYLESEFATGYNAAIPLGLENTRLVWKDGFLMKIEDAEVGLAEVRFRAHQGHAILEAELGNAGPIKITKSLETFSVRLKDHSPVISIKRNGEATVVKYRRTDHDSYPHTRLAAALLLEPPLAATGDLPFQILSRPQNRDGPYQILVSEKNRLLAETRLRACTTRQDYTTQKGDISEDIIKRLLYAVGFGYVKHHPFGYGLGTSRDGGPDFAAQDSLTHGMYYVEAKWWGDADDSISRARNQVGGYCKRYTSYQDEPIVGAYIASMQWDIRTTLITIMVERVR